MGTSHKNIKNLKSDEEVPLGWRRTWRRWWTAGTARKASSIVRDHQVASDDLAFSNALHLEGGGELVVGGWL